MAALYDLYDNTKFVAQTTSANRPAIVATGGANGTSRIMQFASGAYLSSGTALGGSGSNLVTYAPGNLNAATFYLVETVKADNASATQRFFQRAGSNSQGIALRNTTTARGGATANAAATSHAAQETITPDTSWHVEELYQSGGQLTYTVDGVVKATLTYSDTTGFTPTYLGLGSGIASGTISAALVGAIGRGCFCTFLPTSAERTSLRDWAGTPYGISTV